MQIDEEARHRATQKRIHVSPFAVPLEQMGWRGATVPGEHRRRVYTVLHNDSVLVTALLLMPGQAGFRHSHESGELSVTFSGPMSPMISWNPPGMLHGGAEFPAAGQEIIEKLADMQVPKAVTDNPEIAQLLGQMAQMQETIRLLHSELQQLRAPQPGPRLLIDLLFPPFRTTVDDPAYPGGQRTFEGQWYD